MTNRALTAAMRQALAALLTGPLRRGRHAAYGDGWLAQDRGYHGLAVIRGLYKRGLVLEPSQLVVLSIAGRREAQRIRSENTTRHDAA